MMGRVYNFSAGPAVLPEEVLREAAEEMLDYNGSGMSVMEMSHRSNLFRRLLMGRRRISATLWGFRTIIKYCSCRAGRPPSLP